MKRTKSVFSVVLNGEYVSTKIRFQRQKAIDNFIADFYCHKAKLIIEIDGSQHYTEEGRQKDEFRTEILEWYDLKVIRFTNRQINTNFSGVCEYIDSAVKASLREVAKRREGSE